jgi:hypothetical protein
MNLVHSRLFNGAVSTAIHSCVSDRRTVVTVKLKKIGKETGVTYCKITIQTPFLETKKIEEKSEPGNPACGPRMEHMHRSSRSQATVW